MARSSRRRLIRAALTVAGVVAFMLPGMAPAFAATITVNSTADPGDGTCDSTECTLHEAIDLANVDTAPDTITFDITPDTISPAAELPPITQPVLIDGTSDPDVDRIEIDGSAAGIGSRGFRFSGGSSTIQGVVVNGFSSHGVLIEASSGGNTISGSYIGTNVAGSAAVANGGDGIFLASSGNSILDSVVSGNGTSGLSVTNGSTGNTIAGNYIGTAASGATPIGNQFDGILIISSSGTTIGGTVAGSGNVISGNGSNGIQVQGNAADNTLIRQNTVGLASNGSTDLGNGAAGVLISNNTSGQNLTGTDIGGPLSGQGNVISGNGTYGIRIDGRAISDVLVAKNFIGTDAAGTADRGNDLAGIRVANLADATIGGASPDHQNVISGNGSTTAHHGIDVQGADAVLIQGNYVGMQPDGTAILPNSGTGVNVSAQSATIGGTNPTPTGNCTAPCNLISANTLTGLSMGTPNAVVTGNYIGTDVAGLLARGNGFFGIRLGAGAGVTIGGTTPGQRNIVSGNDRGVGFEDVNARFGTLIGNYIGVARDGSALGNDAHGVRLNSDGTTVGGTAAAEANVIANNGWDGVFVSANASGNRILGNSIHTNGASPGDLGIDHLEDGVTENDADANDEDSAGTAPGNDLQNFPEVTGAFSGNGTTLVLGGLDSTAVTDYRIELFQNTSCDTSGNGEGQTFVASFPISTDDDGDAVMNLSHGAELTGPVATTATDLTPGSVDDSTRGETSEFSDCVQVKPDETPPPNPTISAAPPPDQVTSDNTVDLSWTMPVDLADDLSEGSGVAGYSFAWSAEDDTEPDMTVDASAEATSENETLSDGEWWFHIRTVDRLGNWSDADPLGPFMIDTVGPGAPSLSSPSGVFSLSPSIPLGWSEASDGGGSGVAEYTTRVRSAPFTNGFGAPSVVSTDEETSDTFFGAPGNTHCFTVIARDRAGNESVASGERCTAVPVNDTAFSTRKFKSQLIPGAYSNTAVVGKKRKATILMNGVEADQLALVISRCRKCGVIRVSFAGVKVKVNTKGPNQRQVLVSIADFPSSRVGTVKIVKPKKKGKVIVEGLGVSAV